MTTLMRRLFPRIFQQPEGVSELHRALEELEPSTNALREKLDREEWPVPASRNAIANRLAHRAPAPGEGGAT